jgi:ABC-type nitrate/sulfonate/bicarbonate transport system permease component
MLQVKNNLLPILRARRFWQGSAPRRFGLAVLVAFGLLILLEWGLPALGVPAFIVPRPTQIWAELTASGNGLYRHAAVTAAAACLGLLLGIAFGCGLAVLFVLVRPLGDALYPWAIVTQTVPLAAIAPLLILWFGNGIASRIVTAALFAFFPILLSALQGLRRVDRERLDLLHSYGATRWQTLRLLRWPSALPTLFGGLKIAATSAVVGAVVGELAGANQGLGFVITVAGYHLETARTFAAVALASAISLLLYGVVVLIERRVVFWTKP